ncbi:uncharacterized protein HaLaN_08344, partial [Haematococcus lacustris]
VQALSPHGTAAPSLLSALLQVWRQEGAASLWKGNLATIIHRVPYSATNFAVFEATKEALEPHMESDILRRLVAGGSAGLVACTAVSRYYPHALGLPPPSPSLTHILAKHVMPSNLLYRPTQLATLLCASAAGFCTSTVTFPLDVVRKRMQMVRAHPGTSLTYLQVWSLVYRQAGVRGFYAGIVPEYCKVLPGMAIAFATYEGIRAAFDVGS